MLERLCLEKLKVRKGPMQGFGISFLPSTEAKKNNSFRHGQATLPFRKTHKSRGRQRIENFPACCLFTILVLASNHNPVHTVAALPRWEKRSKTLHQSTTDHMPEKFRKAPLTSDRGTTRPRKNVMAKPPHNSCMHDAPRNAT